MIRQSLEWAAQNMGASSFPQGKNHTFHGVSTDTRELNEGELFFCLQGTQDGHTYANKALEKGAAAIVIDEQHTELQTQLLSEKVIVVSDTLRALGDLAQAWRKQFQIPVIAITGSNGKTTTKELVHALLRNRYQVLATEGNFNNLIGVPKTLFRLGAEHQIAVVEMGMNDFGEIARLTEIAQPTHALITNIGAAHLEKMQDLAGVAQAKGELFLGLSPQATAIVNVRDPWIAKMKTSAKKILIGTPETELWGEVFDGPPKPGRPLHFRIHQDKESYTLDLKIPGQHHLDNVLLALAIAKEFQIPIKEAKKSLENFQLKASRLELVEFDEGPHIIDDSYNANPTSMIAALRTLSDLKRQGKALAILGDMAELGASTQKGHEEVGREAAEQGIDYLIAIGQHAADTLRGAQEAGFSQSCLRSYPNIEKAKPDLEEMLKNFQWILVKGSRASHLENLIQWFKEKYQKDT